jgi:hypothetical protein
MTGLKVPVCRGKRWQRVEIETLSDAELLALAADADPERGWAVACCLASWIRDNVRLVPWEELGDLAGLDERP